MMTRARGHQRQGVSGRARAHAGVGATGQDGGRCSDVRVGRESAGRDCCRAFVGRVDRV